MMKMEEVLREVRIIQENNELSERHLQKSYTNVYQAVQSLKVDDVVDAQSVGMLINTLALINNAITNTQNIKDRLNKFKNTYYT